MCFSISELIPKNLCTFSGIAGITVFTFLIFRLSRGPNLDAFPTVGSRTWLGSWRDGLKYATNAVDMMQEGYEKHKTAPFKIADLFHWTVIVSSREHIEELARAPEEELSFVEGANDRLNSRYTLGDDLHVNSHHLGGIRAFTRNIGLSYPEIRDEIVNAFEELLDLRGEEWKSLPALNLIQTVVCRTSNRLFVGLPLCRDPDWISLVTQYALDVWTAGYLLSLFPKFTRHLAVFLFPGVARGPARGLKYLRPMIENRLNYSKEYESGDLEKPNDLLSWLMEEANGQSLTPESLTIRILFVNMTAIHTTSNSFAHSLFYLAENPQYVQPLREEVESIVEKEGWSKASLSKMRKVDSFVKESQRLQGMDAMTILRKALKDYTFADGTFIPKGTLIGVPSRSVHYDEKFYENANTFMPFRFVDIHGEDGDGVKGQCVSNTAEYLSFGHGRHACPGRFFAANELKSMLAHVVVTYDIKLEENTARPRSSYFGTLILPDSRAKVLFRRRVE